MLKRVFVAASLALAAFAPLPAGAQSAQTETVVVVPLERLPVYGSVVSAWYKQPVYDPNEKKLGSIADMLFSADGSINAVMLNVGGFLGLGVKHIAIPGIRDHHHSEEQQELADAEHDEGPAEEGPRV